MKTLLVKPKEDLVLKPVEDTQFVLDFSDIDPEQEYVFDVEFEKEGVSAEIIGLYRLSPKGNLSFTTVANHKVPHTSCMTIVRGVLEGDSDATYIGKIYIQKDAQETSSFLDDKVLVIGENTKHRSDPILEISANDVKASHGSTTGRVDKEQTFYLKSRGLNDVEAQNLIVEGFFEGELGKIVDDAIREKVRGQLNA